eukprot:CAMPEP_0172720378 /NCGR_PEP_ID=MMETSP1074-20121228/76764_1 /TAXON_ID=2916 /ORGANISM="Ceratium fusus, Strain PA161109" /LENGTH=135 /DNA_ID=CAMNT_0013545887 /DNA_START=49 /DNA_END=452 /DNA_ORIENTATION=+
MSVEDKPLPQADFASEPEPPKPKEESSQKEDSMAIFKVMIVGVRGIRQADWRPGPGKPACYCEVKRGETPLHRTTTIDGSTVLRWAEEFGVWEYEIGESLEFKVWDSDVAGAKCLGKVTLTPDAYMEKGCNMEFP